MAANGKVKVGLIGCGAISGIYFRNAPRFGNIEIAAVADLVPERAQAKAAEHHIPKVYTPEELLADPEIEIVLNLTIPIAHASIAFAALNAGKSVYNEKPLTITREDGQKLLALARQKGLRVGGGNSDGGLASGRDCCGKPFIQQAGEDHDGNIARFTVGDTEAVDEFAFDAEAFEGRRETAAATMDDENFVTLFRKRSDLRGQFAHDGIAFQ